MSEEVLAALKQIDEYENQFNKYIEVYEGLLDKKYILIENAFFMRLLSHYTRKNYLYKIRLHYSTYAYDCGMLNENMTKLLLTLDGVLSYGDPSIKAKRKALVNKIQLLQTYLSKLHLNSKRLLNWFTTKHLEPIQLLSYPNMVVEEKSTCEEPVKARGCSIY